MITYLRRDWNNLRLLEGVPLIKIRNQSGQQYLCKLSKQEPPMLNTMDKNCISDVMKTFLVSCGVNFCIDQELNEDDKYHLASKGYVREPNIQSIVTALEERCKILGLGQIKKLMDQFESALKVQLMNLLPEHNTKKIPDFVSKLPLFQVHNSNMFVAADICRLVDEEDIPDGWNERMSRLVVKKPVVARVAQRMKITEWTFKEICEDMILQHMGDKQKSSFFDWIIRKLSVTKNHSESFLRVIKPYLHVQTANNISPRKKPSDLFERSDLCRLAFRDEENKFPNQKYNTGILKKLGLKTSYEVSVKDIELSINEIRKNCTSQASDALLSKVAAMLKLIMQNSLRVRSLPWIPVAVEKSTNYPTNLCWFKKGVLATPEELFVKGDECHVGSVCCLVHPKINDLFEQCFRERKQPKIEDVLVHLENIHQSYDDEEKGCYKKMTFKVYEYLSENPLGVLAHKQLLKMIWQGHKFVPLNQVTTMELDVNVEPYFFKIPSDVSSRFGDVLLHLVNRYSAYDLYLSVLKRIAGKDNVSKSTIQYQCDLQLSIKLVKYLANNELEKCLDNKEKIYVPINGPVLRLSPLSECYYVDKANSGKYQASVSSNKILHSEFGKEIAKKLKVTNLINKVLGGRNSSFIKPWGQTEPLTLRLKRLLEEYQDGLAIIKELIQNADDAGASTVKLLYDKRQNNDMKDLLFDPGMRYWQGPALWVFNDQVFTESDFENITKINAGTKEFDTKKIGKFGLGFNSVYHLTDVPSFFSNDSLVVFDPHGDYLDEALESKDAPGIRIKLSENFEELSNFRHQFEVYNGIFDATFDFDNGHFDSYNGTLFRLPLRQQGLAKKSEIRQLEYSDKEVQGLLSKLKESLSDLILFTSNVNCIEVFELEDRQPPPKCVNEEDFHILFKVYKTSFQLGNRKTEGSIIDLANGELERAQGNSYYKPKQENLISRTEMNVWHSSELFSTQHWLTVSSIGSKDSFQFALKNKGHLPCGGVSIPCEMFSQMNLDEKKFEGKLFCFLPLPIKANLPFHVNAAFSISRNRQSLQAPSTDNKYNKVSSWNNLLGSDLGQSYISLLSVVSSYLKFLPSIDEWCHYLLPTVKDINQKPIYNMVKKMLYTLVDDRNGLRVIPGSSSWLSWNSIRILEYDIPTEISECYKSFLNWNYSSEKLKEECVIFPKGFHQLLQKFGLQPKLDLKIVRKYHLFKMFLEKINNENLDQSIKDEILSHLLSLRDERLKKLLESHQCIPTKPNGTLKRPSELVKEDSPAANVYTIEDEVFPDVESEHFDYLASKLGMSSIELPWSMLIERAKSIEELHTAQMLDEARNRLKYLLQLIKTATPRCPQNGLEQLKNISFLEVLPRPNNRLFMAWFSEQPFGKPAEMYTTNLQDAVSCSSFVCKNSLPENIASLLKQSPTSEHIIHQLQTLIQAYKSEQRLSAEMLEVLTKIYECVDNTMDLQDLEWVRTKEDGLARASQVFIDITTEIPGFLYKLQIQDKCIYLKVKALVIRALFLI